MLSALVGGITGGLLGGVFSQFWHLCFAAGTPVATEGGLKPIEQIEAGEQVWAYNFRTGGWELRPVVEPLSYDYAGDMVRIELAEEVIEATGHHPFWVIEGEALKQRPTPQHVATEEPGNRTTPGRWVDARDLRVGDVFLLRSGRTARVRGLVSRTERLLVYNLHVAELHTYAVGQGGVLVHNRITALSGAAEAVRDLGGDMATRAKDLFQELLTRSEKQGTTIAVSRVRIDGQWVEVVTVNGGAPASAARKIQQAVESQGGIFRVAPGRMHAERFLYDEFHSMDGFEAIGVSHWRGPCPECRPYFEDEVGFDNIFWDSTFVP